MPYVVGPMRKTSVYLPDRLKEALAAHALATGRSEAEVIRAAVEAAVRAGGTEAPAALCGPYSALQSNTFIVIQNTVMRISAARKIMAGRSIQNPYRLRR